MPFRFGNTFYFKKTKNTDIFNPETVWLLTAVLLKKEDLLWYPSDIDIIFLKDKSLLIYFEKKRRATTRALFVRKQKVIRRETSPETPGRSSPRQIPSPGIQPPRF